eukprot:1158030-Pelagomonas_calceolata.AAC.3
MSCATLPELVDHCTAAGGLMRRACGNQVLEVLHEVGQCHGRTNLHALLSGLQLQASTQGGTEK